MPLRLPPFALGGVTIRRVMLFGFGATFALWLVSTYEVVERLGELEDRVAAISTRFADSEELLFTVKAQVLLGSVHVRDAILDTGRDRAFYREQLQNTRVEIERALEQYVPDVDSDIEREQWAQLRGELEQYWDTTLPVLREGFVQSRTEAQALLLQDVMVQRERIIRISEAIQTLNHAAFTERQEEAAQLHSALRRRVWWASGITALLGLGIAVAATRYAGRLEARIRRQHLQEVRHKRDLQRLSAKLLRAQEEERRVIARDLHDEIGQALVAVKMELARIERSLRLSGEADLLGEVRSTMDHVLQTVRDLSQLLHPAMLDEFGLPTTLTAYLRSFSRRTGVAAELVQGRMDKRLGSELEVCTYRIVQEALTNVAKHAQARSCRVSLQQLPPSLLITVEDDGRGLDPQHPVLASGDSVGGLGLMGIRERASGLGGTFRLDSQVGKGTRLTVELPLSAIGSQEGPGQGAEIDSDIEAPASSFEDTLDGHTTPLAR